MISILFYLIASLNAFADNPIPAGCTHRNFSAEAYKVWTSDGTKQNASEEAAQSKSVSLGKRAELQLVTKGSEYRGFVNFEIPADGIYVIATDAYPRIDLIDTATNESLTPVDFGKIRDCGTVSKTLRFELTKTRKFQLGFISSQSPVLNVLVWKLN